MSSNEGHSSIERIPLCSTNTGPFDNPEDWETRLNEEFAALIRYVEENKKNNTEWFTLDCNENGTRYARRTLSWFGECWHVHNMKMYKFKLELEIPAAYPNAPFDIIIRSLEGKTAKMYRGGRICLDAHFLPLWQKNAPKYGIAHGLALGVSSVNPQLAPWLACEIPHLINAGVLEAA